MCGGPEKGRRSRFGAVFAMAGLRVPDAVGWDCSVADTARQVYNDTPKDDRGSITIDSPISDSTFKLECQEFKPGLVRCENKDDDIHIYIGN